MGRQINFFMTLEDETAFCEFVLSAPGVAILPERTPSTEPAPLVPPLQAKCPSVLERSLVLWNSSILVGPKYARHHLGFSYTAGSQEGGIEFTRSVQDGSILRAGRLWTEPAFFVGLSGAVKEPDKKRQYDKWVTALFRWIRQRYVKYCDMFYIGPGAVQFQEMGGKLGPTYREMDDPDYMERRSF